MQLAAMVAPLVAAALAATIALAGCQSPTPADTHRCVVTPNETVECSETG